DIALPELLTRLVVYLTTNVHALVVYFLLLLLFPLPNNLASVALLICTQFCMLIFSFYILLSILHVFASHIVCELLFASFSPLFYLTTFYSQRLALKGFI